MTLALALALVLTAALVAVAALGAQLWGLRRRLAHQARHGELLDQVHDAVIVHRLGATILYWNRGAEQLYGWKAADVLGRSCDDLLGTQSGGGLSRRAIQDVLLREGRWAGQLQHKSRDGRALVVESRQVLVRTWPHAPAVLETNHDITARCAGERSQRVLEAKLRAVVETAVDTIITIDERGIIQTFNPAAERVFGYRASEIIGMNVRQLMPEPYRSEHDGYLARYLRTGERRIIGIGREALGRRKDGSVFPVELAVGESDIDGQRLFTGILRDVTYRKRHEEEREHLLQSERAARAEAERAARMKDEFLATLSHELRTPLTAILGWVSLLRRGDMNHGAAARALDVIEKNTRAQAQLVDDLLDVSRIVAGKLRIDLRPADLAEVVTTTTAALQPSAAAKHVQLEAEHAPHPAIVLGDPARLQQIVWNLVSNALKFTPRGGKVTVSLDRSDASMDLVVRDTGQGIDPEFLPHVFERFRQADSSTTRRHAGLGLGLALVRHIAEQHGGTVRAESAGRGRGSTFVVSLPAADLDIETAPSPCPHNPCAALAGVKVLVVDDDDDVRDLVRRILEECAAVVSAVATALDALDEVQKRRPDVMLADIGMPDHDGYQLVRALRALPADRGGSTPAAALTAFARAEDRDRALAAGYQLHIAKPIDADGLVRAVASLVRPAA